MNWFRASSPPWLIITLSTLAAGTISTFALMLKEPVAIIISSGLGALGGSAATQSRKQQQAITKADQAREKNTIKAELKGEKFQHQAMYPITSPPGLVTPPSANRNITPFQANTAHLKTVILFDIENLTEGYKNRNGHIYRVSIREILEQIKAVEMVGEIVGQYAYADWSNSALKTIRQEISQLGIKPEQFINFEHDIKKNATDIQLSVDAIHLVHQNPIIGCVVIVSGDGGFASLAEKLRWYGKILVGCAYENSASKKLQAMCHHFVQIPYPVEQRPQETLRTSDATHPPTPARPILRHQLRTRQPAETVTNLPSDIQDTTDKIADLELPPPAPLSDPNSTASTSKPETALKHRRKRKRTSTKTSELPNISPTPSPRKAMVAFAEGLVSQLTPITANSPIEAAQKIQELLNAYFYLSPKSQTFQTEGIVPSLLEPVIRALIPNLTQVFLPIGIIRFNEYLRFACQGAEFCLARAGQDVKLCLRTQIPESFTIDPDVAPKPLHAPETYRQILATDFGKLFNDNNYIFKESLPSASMLEDVGLALIELKPCNQDMADLVDKLVEQTGLQRSQNVVRQCLLVFHTAGVVTIELTESGMRHISLTPGIKSRQDLHQALLNTLQAKLTPILATISETINQDVLASLLFSLEPLS